MVKSSKLIHAIGVCGLALGALGMSVGGPLNLSLQQAQTETVAKAATLDELAGKELTVTIHKYKSNASDGGVGSGIAAADGSQESTIAGSHDPLGNVPFTIQKVIAADGYTTSQIDPKNKDTFTVVDGTLKSGKTEADGTLKFDLGTYEKDKGIYLVKEQPLAGITTKVDDFLVQLPLQNATKDGFITDVNVYPKNVTEDETMNPTKTFANTDKRTPVELGGTVSWNLAIDVPKGAYSDGGTPEDATDDTYAKSVYVIDPVDTEHLAFTGNPTATYVDDNGVTQELTMDGTANGDFNFDGDDTGAAVIPGHTNYKYTLNPSGMKKAAGHKVTFTLTTTVTSFADANTDGVADPIVNTFDSFYVPATGAPVHETTVPDGVDPANPTDPTDPGTVDPTDPTDPTPAVEFGRLDVTKVDQSDKTEKLANAEFKIATSEANAKAGTFVKYVDGMTNADGTAVDKDEDGNVLLKTDADGAAAVNGLAMGKDADGNPIKYYLVETKAPTGYELSDEVYAVTIDADADSDVTVEDQKDIVSEFLPVTGGQLRIILMVAGSVMILGSGTALYIKKRKENANLAD